MTLFNEYAKYAKDSLQALRRRRRFVRTKADGSILEEPHEARLDTAITTAETAVGALEQTCLELTKGLQFRDQTIRELKEALETERARYSRLKARHDATLANME